MDGEQLLGQGEGRDADEEQLMGRRRVRVVNGISCRSWVYGRDVNRKQLMEEGERSDVEEETLMRVGERGMWMGKI